MVVLTADSDKPEDLVDWRPIFYRPLASEIYLEIEGNFLTFLIPGLRPSQKIFSSTLTLFACGVLVYGASFSSSIGQALTIQTVLVFFSAWAMSEEKLIFAADRDCFVRQRRIGLLKLPSSCYGFDKLEPLTTREIKYLDQDAFFTITSNGSSIFPLSSLSTRSDVDKLKNEIQNCLNQMANLKRIAPESSPSEPEK